MNQGRDAELKNKQQPHLGEIELITEAEVELSYPSYLAQNRGRIRNSSEVEVAHIMPVSSYR